MESNELEGICIPQHTTLEERLSAARLCAQRLKLTIPTLVDSMDNSVSRRFAAWPERIYIIGTDGRVTFKGGPGPSGFDIPAASKALEALLA